MTVSPAKRLADALAPLDREARLLLAERAGVAEIAVSRARGQCSVTADNFLRLCAAIGIDPTPDIPRAPVRARIGWLDHATLGLGIRSTRYANKHSIRDAVKASRISLTTISPMEHGQPVSIENIGAHPLGYVTHVKQRWNALKSLRPAA